MAVSALGSSFSFIPPERVAQSEPSRSRETATAEASPPQSSSSPTSEPAASQQQPSDQLAPETRSSLLSEQESSASNEKPVSHRAAAQAYSQQAA